MRAVKAESERERWQGKFAIVKHENNQLRKKNKIIEQLKNEGKLRDEKIEYQSKIVEFVYNENEKMKKDYDAYNELKAKIANLKINYDKYSVIGFIEEDLS